LSKQEKINEKNCFNDFDPTNILNPNEKFFFTISAEQLPADCGLSWVSLLLRSSTFNLTLTGPSGSGKSTLLNTLACRLDVKTIVQGEMRLNGALYDNAELKRIAGYVMQDDLLNGQLTIEETLMYTAELRLPRSLTKEQRKTRIEDVIIDIGLNDVRHQIIGSHMKQGISGSERKRLCVAMQLLSRPQLLFLDEPTTGLDSVTAFDLLQTLHALAHGKSQQQAVTIVCSIHQPQSKIFDLFDDIILLRSGHVVYQGSRKQVMVNKIF